MGQIGFRPGRTVQFGCAMFSVTVPLHSRLAPWQRMERRILMMWDEDDAEPELESPKPLEANRARYTEEERMIDEFFRDKNPPAKFTTFEELRMLGGLRDRGMVTAEEFGRITEKLLGEREQGRATKQSPQTIFDAVFANDVDLLRKCLGVDSECVNLSTERHGWTPLHFAVSEGNCEITRLLLEHGAMPDKPSTNGKTAIHHAAHRGLFEIVRILLLYGADPNYLYRNKTVRERAAEQEHADIVELIDRNYPEPS